MFVIQASAPAFFAGNQGYGTLEGAIQDVFDHPTEDIWICWNGCFVPLAYKYDLSWIIDEIQDMLEELLTEPVGHHRAEFSDDAFHVNWSLRWNGEDLRIESEWKSITGTCRDLLNGELGNLQVGKTHFICEWKRPLGITLSALSLGGYTEQNLPELPRLQALFQMIPREGGLYCRG